MHHALMLASRIVAGIFAGIAFYFAFFLYEDEEGVWQNRIENLWISIYDRAKVVDSTSTALFNRIGDLLNKTLISLFGENLISARSIVISSILSFGGAALSFIAWSLFTHGDWLFPVIFLLIGSLVFGAIFLASKVRSKFGRRILLISTFMVILFLVRIDFTLPIEPIILPISWASDVLAVIAMRRLFYSLSETISLRRIMLTLATLVLLAATFSLMFGVIPLHLITGDGLLPTLALQFTLLNVTTALFCMIPAIMVAVVLLHRIAWPVLSRLLYPVATKRLVTDKQILLPVGTLALTFAFGIEHVGAKELLKLLSS